MDEPQKDQPGRLSRALTAVRRQTRVEPIECPRGWGQVPFQVQLELWEWLPQFGRTCPIGGVRECASCRYDAKPDVSRLSEQLAELARMRDNGELTPDEYGGQRHALTHIHLTITPIPGHRSRVAAWILGPLGITLVGVGAALSPVHIGFLLALSIVGSVAASLGFSFGMLSRLQRARSGDGSR